MKRLVILIATSLFFNPAFSQLIKSYSIHFEKNVHTLNPKQKQELDSLVKSLANIPEAFFLEVTGHTDNIGSLPFNTTLSKNRASAVLSYFKNIHFKTSDSSLRYYAYNRPAAANSEDNLWKNRRVEIKLYARKLDMPKILGITDFKPKKYKLIEDIGGTLTYDSTKIIIRPNSFMHKNSTEVTGEIDVSYSEYRNPSDFILSGIPMSIDIGNNQTGHFNSAGMFLIKAFQNGEELVLKSTNDKKINLEFPLTNFVDQRFYQFDTTQHKWNNNGAPITDPHGSMLFPFGGSTQTNNNLNDDFYKFLNCRNNDTCDGVLYAVNKINYFLTHDEPIRLDYPFKFMKNNLVDFKSAFYSLLVDTTARSIEFIPQNANSKLGSFSDYVWVLNKKDFENCQKLCVNGCSFVKVIFIGKNKFQLEVEKSMFRATGAPKNKNLSASKLKKLNKKNFKSYLKYTQDLDEKEKVLENEFNEKMYNAENNYNRLNNDSLYCINSFYKIFLRNSDDRKLVSIENFNLYKNILAENMKALPTPFKCSDAKKILIRRDSIERAIEAKHDSAVSLMKSTFAKFDIDATGIYNADQIRNIKDPVDIIASYKNEKGQSLKIISIYINVKGLNGTINYNGYNNLGPYKFKYGRNDECMLIAVDENEKSYYCTQEEFAAFTKGNENKPVIFKLKYLKNLENSSKLEKLVLK